ncbi:TPA: hypothetical protein ACF3I9_004477 [Klebsiella aerogenes]
MSKTLRQRIKEKILVASNNDEATINICKMLDEEFDLMENGWFDDDDEMMDILIEEYDKDE